MRFSARSFFLSRVNRSVKNQIKNVKNDFDILTFACVSQLALFFLSRVNQSVKKLSRQIV